MLNVKRFSSFEDIKQAWQQLERASDHSLFQEWWYQNLFARHFCDEVNLYLLGIYTDNTLLAVGAFEKVGTTILFLGTKQVLEGEYLTDYGDILLSPHIQNSHYIIKSVWNAFCTYFGNNSITSIRLDFVREDSQTLISFQEHNNNDQIVITPQDVAPYILSEATWEDYLASLARTKRHELKRKLKRFESLNASYVCSDNHTRDDFESFIQLFRLSNAKKEKFMSEKMKSFFWDIFTAEKTSFETRLWFLCFNSKKVAGVLLLINSQKVLVYNSGYDSSYAYYSFGLMLHAFLIKNTIEKKYKVYDFLRGNERYKYDLGAKDIQLHKINISLL